MTRSTAIAESIRPTRRPTATTARVQKRMRANHERKP